MAAAVLLGGCGDPALDTAQQAAGAAGAGSSAGQTAVVQPPIMAAGGVSVAGDAGNPSTAGSAGLGGSIGSSGGMGAGQGGTSSGGATAEPMLPACESNEVARCTGSSPIKCDFGGVAGDYLVTLDLGGASASTTLVDAEAHRRMLGSMQLVAGEIKRFAFGVNVRQPEGQPIQDVPAGTPGLQLQLAGAAPQLSAICVKPLAATPKLWIAGDSTVCDQSDTSYAGWGQHLPQYFAAPVVVANYADSGESSSSVLSSAKLWGAIKAGWKAGDWVMVQVGHNDKTVSASVFRDNITAFVTQAKAANVHIVLCTPISRVGSALSEQHQSSGGANIPQIIKDVAESENVPLIDLTTVTWNWLQTVDWRQYFALGTDRTHTNPAGAAIVAGFVRDALREQQLELAQHLR